MLTLQRVVVIDSNDLYSKDPEDRVWHIADVSEQRALCGVKGNWVGVGLIAKVFGEEETYEESQMRKQLQVNTGNGWCNLSSEFYERGKDKDEQAAQRKMEVAAAIWPFRYEPYRNAQFRILDEGI